MIKDKTAKSNNSQDLVTKISYPAKAKPRTNLF